MANELQISWTFQVNKNNLVETYQGSIIANMSGFRGPTPDAIQALITGTTISLSGIANFGGWCIFKNLDTVNFVSIGLYIGSTFYPVVELLPGESFPVRLSRYLLSGTGTDSAATFKAYANTANCNIQVKAFDS